MSLAEAFSSVRSPTPQPAGVSPLPRSQTALWSGLASFARQTARGWRWLREIGLVQSKTRRLRVTETVSLGEKRFVSIVQIDGAEYLIGGGSGHVALLVQLGQALPSPSFQQTVQAAWEGSETA